MALPVIGKRLMAYNAAAELSRWRRREMFAVDSAESRHGFQELSEWRTASAPDIRVVSCTRRSPPRGRL